MKTLSPILAFILCLSLTAGALCADITYYDESGSTVDEGGIFINGDIKRGDYAKFINEISRVIKNKDAKGFSKIGVYLNSTGGDLEEAMKIGNATREMLMTTNVGLLRNYKMNPKATKCFSACFFIWVAGIERVSITFDHRPLGIHRVYYDRHYYKELSSEKAEIKYKTIKDSSKKYLEEMGVPLKYFDLMYKTASNEIYLLNDEEIDSLDGHAPYYAEMIISRCDPLTKIELRDHSDCAIPLATGTYWPGTSSDRIEECKKMSPGYLKFLLDKNEKASSCIKKFNSAEQWKRIDQFLSKSHK